MTKENISSREVRARSLVIYELDQFIKYIKTIDPELRADQALVITAFLIKKLPELFEKNPHLMDQLNDMILQTKLNH